MIAGLSRPGKRLAATLDAQSRRRFAGGFLVSKRRSEQVAQRRRDGHSPRGKALSISISISVSLSLSLYIYIYTSNYISLSLYLSLSLYIYIYI